MNKKTKIAKVLLTVFMLSLSFHIWTQAQETKMYFYYIKEDGSVSRTNAMDSVATVKTTQTELTGITFDGTTKELTLNGLNADTLRIYAKKFI